MYHKEYQISVTCTSHTYHVGPHNITQMKQNIFWRENKLYIWRSVVLPGRQMISSPETSKYFNIVWSVMCKLHIGWTRQLMQGQIISRHKGF